MRPTRVVVTTSVGVAATEYLEALREAGVEPVRVDSDTPDVSLVGAAGLLVAGGEDVDPAMYGAPPSPLIGVTEPDRDALEIALLRDARTRGLPTLCICRGLQIANVAFGGTLLADIPHTLGTGATIPHRVGQPVERGVLPEHVVRIDAASRLARIVATIDLATGSRHHQAVDRCASDLAPVGKTDDGIVEALEARFASPFWLAVQWHPESTRTQDAGASRALFTAFAQAVRSR